MKKGPYEVLSSKITYTNPWIIVREDKVLKPDGKEGLYGVVDYGRGVSVVALDNESNIFLIKEYYYAIEEYAYEVPTGGVDEGESPQDAAKRELLEEAGVTAEKWIELGYVNPLTTIIKSPAYLYLAKGIAEKQKPDSEIVELKKVPFEEAYHMVLDSKITHAPSCVAILKAKIYLDKNKVI